MWVQQVPGGGIDGLCFAPDGRTLYVADRSCTFTAWDVAAHTGRRLFRLTGPDRGLVRGIALAAAGRYLVVRNYPPVVAWDLVADAEAARLRPPFPHEALPVPGADDRVLYFSSDRRSLLAWNPALGTTGEAFTGPFPRAVRAYALSGDARTVAFSGEYSSEVSLFDLATRTETARLNTGRRFVWGVRFAPNGRALAVFFGQEVELWDISAARPTRVAGPVGIDNRSGEAAFAFHPTAPAFVALNRDKVLTLFGTETGSAIRSLDFALGRSVTCACFSPDGLTCAVGGSNKRFAVFDVDL